MKVSEILEKYVAGLNSGNADQVAELYAEECDFRIDAVPDMEENIDIIVRDFLKKEPV